MPKLDVQKEIVSFLTRLFFILMATIVLLTGSLATMYNNENIAIVFWLGCASVLFLAAICIIIFAHIKKHINIMEKL